MVVSLRSWHTFQMRATADGMIDFSCEQQLSSHRQWLTTQSIQALVLGHGSNIVFSQHFAGWILLNRIMGVQCIAQDDETVFVEVGAGESWHRLVLYCLQQGWYGLENLISIPGTVGAAPVQNIGAYGVELADVLHSCRAFCWRTGRIHVFSQQECGFAYRTSVFKQRALQGDPMVITSVTLRLSKQAFPVITYPRLRDYLAQHYSDTPMQAVQIAQAVHAIRRARLPNWTRVGTVGSFFINPIVEAKQWQDLQATWPGMHAKHLPDGQVKLFAGNLLDMLGLSGYRLGGLQLSSVNPIVVINDRNATYTDLSKLLTMIQAKLQGKFGLTLSVEPQVI